MFFLGLKAITQIFIDSMKTSKQLNSGTHCRHLLTLLDALMGLANITRMLVNNIEANDSKYIESLP
jgi:hypothetical protein